MKIKPNQKHLTFEQRNIIEQGLNSGFSLIEIANSLKKDPTTISKEIKRNRIKKEANIYNSKNICKNLVDCNLRDICKAGCKVFCKTCEICNERCKDFTPKVCKRLTRYPYTCNNCTRKSPCRLEKYYYKALTSFNTYKSTLSEARRGINLTPDELTHIDSIVSPLIKQGQSISHIHETQNINCSKSSLYNYVEKNYLSVCNLDLARKVRFKKRKQHREPTKDTKIRNGRTYSDFLQYLDKNLDIPVIEMDTVEGKKGGKVLLTLFFRNTKLMLAFIMNDKTSDSVLEVFNRLEKVLGDEESFEKLFPVILTDNGSEFSNPIELEFNKEGIGRTKLFYCDSSASYQKGALEKNHEFIRYVIPKGTSMNDYTQEDVLLMINHINSLARQSLNWNTPYNLARLLLGKDVLKKFNLSSIPAKEIKLTPNLLKKK